MRCDKFKYRMEKNIDSVLRLKLILPVVYNKYQLPVINNYQQSID